MALTRITKGVIKPNENYDTNNINSTGIVTAIGLDVNGNGDISGNLSVGGVLTYEDVTSIDSVGIITAQKGIHVGAGVSAVGVGTFGSLDIGGDIDVDGHTNLDNVNIAGVTTTTDDINLPNNKKVNFGSFGFQMYQNTVPSNNAIIKQSASGQFLRLITNGGALSLESDYVNLRNSANSSDVASFDADGAATLRHNTSVRLETTSTGIDITGNVVATGADINGDLDVDGHTNLDNVSISGVTTTAGNVDINAQLDVSGQASLSGFTTTTSYGLTTRDLYTTGITTVLKSFQVDGREANNMGLMPFVVKHGGYQGIQTSLFTASLNNYPELVLENTWNGNWNSSGPWKLKWTLPNEQELPAGDGRILSELQPTVNNSGYLNGFQLRATDNSTGLKSVFLLKPSQSSFYVTDSSGTTESLRINTTGIGITHSLYHLGNTGVRLYFPGNNNIRFDTNSTERLRIDSSGRLLIGTTTEGNASADDLTIAGSNNVGITIRSGTAHQGAIYFSDATSGNAEFDGFIVYDQNSRELRFGTQQSTRARIDAGGRLLVAATSSSQANSGADDLVVGNTSQGNNGMSIVTNNANIGALFFADQDNAVRGGVRYQHASDLSQFYAGGNVVLNLKNKGVGINETSPTEDALVIRGGDTDDTPRLILKRHTDGIQNDGEIIGKLQFMSNEDNVDSGNHQPRAEIHGVTVNTAGAAKLDFYTVPNSTTTPLKRMTLNQEGRLCVGTADGLGRLNVVAASSATNATSDNSTYVYVSNTNQTNNNYTGITFGDRTDAADYVAGLVCQITDHGNNYGNVQLITNDGSGRSEKVRIETGGVILGKGPFRVGGFGSIGSNQGCRITGGNGSHPACLSLDGGGTPTLELGSKTGETIIGTNSYGSSPMNFKTSIGLGTLVGGTTRFQINSNGNIGAPTGNNIYNASDERLKENMVELTDGLSKIQKLKPISFTWKEGWDVNLDGKKEYGFGAQTTEAVDEMLVEPFSLDDAELNGEIIEKPLRVNEKYIIPLLVKAIQELSAEVAALKAK